VLFLVELVIGFIYAWKWEHARIGNNANVVRTRNAGCRLFKDIGEVNDKASSFHQPEPVQLGAAYRFVVAHDIRSGLLCRS
jgi:hypothetical protein